jgi:hypothetical protein
MVSYWTKASDKHLRDKYDILATMSKYLTYTKYIPYTVFMCIYKTYTIYIYIFI